MGLFLLAISVFGFLTFDTPPAVEGIFRNANQFGDPTFMLLSIPFAVVMLFVPFLILRIGFEKSKQCPLQ